MDADGSAIILPGLHQGEPKMEKWDLKNGEQKQLHVSEKMAMTPLQIV